MIRDWYVGYRLERKLIPEHSEAIEGLKDATVIYFSDRDSTIVGVRVKARDAAEAISIVGRNLRRILQTDNIDASAVSARLDLIKASE